jgi:2'-hydroxyisoflavone reductase
MAEFLAACPGEVEVAWLDDEFLVEHGVGESDLPLWSGDPGYAALHDADVAKAIKAGLTFRPIEETAVDTLEWDSSRKDTQPVGLTREREAELIAAWASVESRA